MAASRPVLDRERDLAARLRGVLRAWVEINESYHEFAGAFFKTAADPRSPMSPFSRDSAPAKARATGIFREVAEGSEAKLPAVLRPELPNLLWLYQMGVVLYWVHDRSPGTEKTYELIDRTVPLIVQLIGMARLRMMRGVLAEVLDLVRSLSGAT